MLVNNFKFWCLVNKVSSYLPFGYCVGMMVEVKAETRMKKIRGNDGGSERGNKNEKKLVVLKKKLYAPWWLLNDSARSQSSTVLTYYVIEYFFSAQFVCEIGWFLPK